MTYSEIEAEHTPEWPTGSWFARKAALLVLLGMISAGIWISPLSNEVKPFALALVWAAVIGILWSIVNQSLRRIEHRSLVAAQWRLIENDTNPGIFTHEDGTVFMVNDVAKAIFGVEIGQTLERGVEKVIPGADGVVTRQIGSVLRHNAAYEVTPTLKGRMRVATQSVHDAILWRFTEERDETSCDGARIGLPMLDVDNENRVLSMNAAMWDLLGRPVESLSEVLPDRDLVPGRRSRLVGAEGPIEVVPIVVPVRNGCREIYAVPGLAEPPAASVAARAFQALPVALLHIAADGRLVAANAPAAKLLNIPEGFSGYMGELVDNLGRPVSEWISDTLCGRDTGRTEVLMAKRQEENTYVQISLSRISDATGASLLAVMNDSTQLKTLEKRVVQAQKMQAVGELAGGIAHDFNNLLTAISGHCDLLLERHTMGEEDYSDLMQIHENVRRAAIVVGQLLAFSRKQHLELEQLDLRDVVASQTNLLHRLVGERTKIAISQQHEPMTIRADRRQLEQVLLNLVLNSRDSMPDGGEVNIETRVVSLSEAMSRDQTTVPAGRYGVLKVTDHGCGIPDDKLQRIFEPFFSSKSVCEHNGLGLSMAYGIVKQSGGYIFVDSVVGSGTIISVYFPIHEAKTITVNVPERIRAPREPLNSALEEGVPEEPSVESRVVLLVEDEHAIREFASRALRKRGFEVLEATCAEHALEILSDSSLTVDLFVSDVVMPGLDGPAWVSKALEDRPDAKVVFVSGYSDETTKARTISVPGARFLAKPFSLSDLADAVAAQLH